MTGPSSAAVGPSNRRATRVGPLTLIVPSRAVRSSRANSTARQIGVEFARSSASSRPRRQVAPQRLGQAGHRGDDPVARRIQLQFDIELVLLRHCVELQRQAVAAGRARPASAACSPPVALARVGQRYALRLPCASTRRSPVTGASATKRSTRSRFTSMSRSGSSGSSAGRGFPEFGQAPQGDQRDWSANARRHDC